MQITHCDRCNHDSTMEGITLQLYLVCDGPQGGATVFDGALCADCVNDFQTSFIAVDPLSAPTVTREAPPLKSGGLTPGIGVIAT